MRVNKLHVKHDQPELDGASHSVYESRPKEAQADFEDDGIGADFVCGFNQFFGLLLVKAAVLYLASDAAKFTTDTTLLVDGGWTAA
jgi:NAD(P)-dependent dehydrogenase (short-subunit alcohol dehydrogenase family)